ncbi:MAG: MBL fold metallo-hydrolase [Spirochaetes bacterium]|nr:MBL fold metallo-hydrolase [Spirochaetota bacterium]
MNKKSIIAIIIVASLILSVVAFLRAKASQVNAGREEINAFLDKTSYKAFPDAGTVSRLTILPLVDFYADDKNLMTEPGVSYLVKADNTTILLDVANDRKKIHPSPLLSNMKALNAKPSDIDMIFITHIHLDHVGGMREGRVGEFSLSQGPVELKAIPVYSPGPLKPSKWNPGPAVQVVSDPIVIAPGIASLGVIPRHLFMFGRTDEQVLAINLKGKGIVLIVGCGHPSAERIIQRAKMLYREPIYAIIGGLHYPVNGGRGNIGPINIQYIVAADRAPWNGINEKDVDQAIDTIRKENIRVISLSPHDSSDWSLERFRKAFPKKYVDLKVGKEIIL